MMAYRKNFVVAIKHRGRILREIDDVVTLPFGSEYSILLKNKDSRKAVANIEIDGQDVMDGNQIIVEPQSTVEITGFMKGMAVRNKFRFIKKTEQISKYRGDRLDDGLVRVEFWFEKQEIVLPKIKRDPNPTPDIWWGGPYSQTFVGSALKSSNNAPSNNVYYMANLSCNCNTVKSKSDDGITVKGTETYQGFSVGNTKELEYFSTVITLKLRGVNKKTKQVIKKAVGVKTRLTCSTCGRKSRSSAKYCSRCSTYLH